MDGESAAAPETPALGPRRGLVEYAQVIYALYAFTVLCSFLTIPIAVLRFVFCLPSLIAIILAYVRRAEAEGSWLESHFSWQIRTFWYAWLWTVVTSIIAIPLLLFGASLWLSLGVFVLIVLWVMYRVARGWAALRAGRPAPLSMV